MGLVSRLHRPPEDYLYLMHRKCVRRNDCLLHHHWGLNTTCYYRAVSKDLGDASPVAPCQQKGCYCYIHHGDLIPFDTL
jgi:hypothetical protein